MKTLTWVGLTIVLMTGAVRGDDWPQWMGPNRDDVWPETGILQKFPANGPKVLWRIPIKGGFAGPAVASGKVYVMDYLTDVDFRKKSSPASRPPIDGKERVLCLDATNGNEIWKFEYDCHYAISYPAGPRCTPTVQDGKVYTLGSEGNLFCLNAGTGKKIWSKEFKTDYQAKTPLWGFCGHPLVDGQNVVCVVGGVNALVVAFDKERARKSGKCFRPRNQVTPPPTMIEAGGKRQLLIWDSENLSSLDPTNGKPYWQVRHCTQQCDVDHGTTQDRRLFVCGRHWQQGRDAQAGVG